MSRRPFLEFREVAKHYSSRAGQKTVFEGFSWTVLRGDRIALVGANGSGKTTLLRMILGVLPANAGSIERVRIPKDHSTAYIPQDYRQAMFPWFSLRTNLALAMPSPTSGASRHLPESFHFSEFDGLCDSFKIHLDLDKYPYELSGGEQQIFLLIRAILSNPAIVVLDEPLSAVDFARKRLIQDYLGSWLSSADCVFIFASHDYEEAVLLADRVLVLSRATPESAQSSEITVALPWPRAFEMRYSPTFRASLDGVTASLL